MEWLWTGAFPIVAIIVLCVVIGFAIQWLNRDVNNILDGKGLVDRNGKPLLGTEAIQNNAFSKDMGNQVGLQVYQDLNKR